MSCEDINFIAKVLLRIMTYCDYQRLKELIAEKNLQDIVHSKSKGIEWKIEDFKFDEESFWS